MPYTARGGGLDDCDFGPSRRSWVHASTTRRRTMCFRLPNYTASMTSWVSAEYKAFFQQ